MPTSRMRPRSERPRANADAPLQGDELVRLMVEAVRDYAIFMLDPDGCIRTWNAGAARLKGYREQEIIGKHFSIFYTEDARRSGHPDEELQTALAEGRYEEEGWRVRKDGTQFWANVVITAVFDRQGRHLGFGKVTRDLTERRQAEEELRRSEERLRLIIDTVPDYAIFTLDTSGRVTSWSPAAQSLKGYSAGEIIGKHFSIFYPEEERRRGHPEDELAQAIANGSYREEGWRVRKDGSRFWASVLITAIKDVHGRHLGFAKVTRDMSDRRHAEELLRQSEERLRLLVESVRDYAIFMLDPAGTVASWNAGAENIKGYRAEEIIGKHFSTFYPPDDVTARRPDRELEIAKEQGRFEDEGWRLRKNGERFWANVVITAVYGPKRELRGFAKITRDLTERRRMELEARKAEEDAVLERFRTFEAEAAVRIRDEFLSVAAHELRTPLTALQLKLQSTAAGLKKAANGESEGGNVSKLGERVQGAVRQIDRLGELVERLLDVSRIVSNKLVMNVEEMDLARLVRQVVDDLREAALQEGSQLYLDAPESLVGAWDEARIEQVIVNLLSNAIKYGRGRPIDVVVQPTDARVRIVVTDRGIGIAPDDVERIFARFERAVSRRHYGGLGLGLYVTRNIVEAHGGSIAVSSTPDEGSTFTVDLPIRTVAPVPISLGEEPSR